MSGSAESAAVKNTATTSGAQDNAPTDQPNDAVQMEVIDQSSADKAQPKTDSPPANHTADATQPADSQPTPANAQGDKPADQPTAGAEAPETAAGQDDAPPPPSKEEDDSALAIGPAQDDINGAAASAPDAPPICNITLLLTSGGRHPYRIDAKYLNRRNVAMPDVTEHGHPDPFSISIYTLKELILREWRADWDAKPASPSSIRLIHFGKLLDDKEQLKSESRPSRRSPANASYSVRSANMMSQSTNSPASLPMLYI